MKKTFLFLFLIPFQHSFSQKIKTYFIDTYGDKVKEKKAIYKRSVTKLNKEWHVTDYYLTGGIQMKATYTDSYLNHKKDSLIYYHINGLPSLKGWYVKGKKHGIWKTYSLIGKISEIHEYDNGKIIGTWVWYDDKGEQVYIIKNANAAKINKDFVKPSYHGGKKMLDQLIDEGKFSNMSYKIGDIGTTYTSLKIDKNGGIKDVDIYVHGTAEMDAYILERIKKMPRWNPAIQYGKPVEVSYNLSITFTLHTVKTILTDKAIAEEIFKSGLEDFKLKKLKRAESKFLEAIEKNYQDPRYYTVLALCYLKLEKIDFACANWNIANMLDKNIVPDNIKKHCRL